MKKKQIEKRILHDSKSASHFLGDNRYRWGEVLAILEDNKIELRDDDIMEVGYTEGYDHGDSSRDAAYDLNVYRYFEETDEAYKKRIKLGKLMKKMGAQKRYENYLKLKEEFENN